MSVANKGETEGQTATVQRVRLALVDCSPAIVRPTDALLRIRMQRFLIVDRNFFPGQDVP